jgi:hypothetical protein
VIFDEQENPEVPAVLPVSPQPPQASIIVVPAEAQRLVVGSPNLPTAFDFGWLFFNLNFNLTPLINVPPEDPTAAQAWMTAVMDADGRFSVGFDAIQLDSATNANHVHPFDQ